MKSVIAGSIFYVWFDVSMFVTDMIMMMLQLLEMAEGNDGGPNPYQQLRGEPLYDYQMDGGKLIPTGNMIAKRSVASVRSPFLQDHQQQEHQNREQKTAAWFKSRLDQMTSEIWIYKHQCSLFPQPLPFSFSFIRLIVFLIVWSEPVLLLFDVWEQASKKFCRI